MAATTVDGDERVIAAAQQIVRSLGTSKNATDDMILILSSFDNRLSAITSLLSPPPAAAAADPLEPLQALVLRWDSPSAGPLPWDDPSDDSPSQFLLAVDRLLSLLSDPPAAAAGGDLLDRAESLLQIAMSRLEDEFRLVISSNSAPLDAESLRGSVRRLSLSFPADYDEEDLAALENPRESPRVGEGEYARGKSLSGDFQIDLVRPEAVEDLREIADRMVRSRYEKECCQVYSGVRREALDECLCVLGVERVSIEEVQRIEWGSLDDRMKRWSQAVRVVARALLPAERQLCDRVFGDARLVKEVCFAESAKGCVMHLLNFAEAVTIGRRSPEKLFRILDMYDALAEAVPELRALFPEGSREYICGEAEGILAGLGDAARGTFAEFEKAIQRETSKKAMHGGEIHPLTRYVMNYSKLLVAYSETLNSLLDCVARDGEDHHHGSDDSNEKYSGSMSPLGQRLRSILSYLEANLVEKSKLYEDGAMQYIFLMNNILYIVQKVKDSELGKLLGDHWVRKHRGQIRQHATSYLRASWTKVLSFLKDEGMGGGGSASSVSKVALKERFKNFNLAYEEVYRTQIQWRVPDPQLREELRISISEKVIPAYRSFVGRFGSQMEGRQSAKYMKYSADDLESHLSDLFEGLPGPSSLPRRKN